MNNDNTTAVNKVADRLIWLAEQSYRFGQTLEGEPIAVPLSGPHVAVFFVGQDQQDFLATLARAYRRSNKTTPTKSQLMDALNAIHGECLVAPREPCFRRVAQLHDECSRIVVDLGTPNGKAVVVWPNSPNRWVIVERSPVLFQRTALTAPLPEPLLGGDLDEIKKLLHLSASHWELLVGWLIAAFFKDIPHPILAIFGPPGSGKSFLAKLLVRMCDPSPAPLRSQPQTEEDWHVAAANSWVVALDNLSKVPPWFSDALCKAATGDARVVRKKYSDKTVSVSVIRLPVIFTGIEIGSLRSDLGDRLVMLELSQKNAGDMEQEAILEANIKQRHAFWLGAIFDALSMVLESLPFTRRPEQLPRMADFGNILATADAAGVTRNAFLTYKRNREEAAQEVAEGDVLVEFIVELLNQIPESRAWSGTATELLEALGKVFPGKLPPEWPKAANVLSRRLRRLSPTLAAFGIQYSVKRNSLSRTGIISLSLSKSGKISSEPSTSVMKSEETREKASIFKDDCRVVSERSPEDYGHVISVVKNDPRTIPGRSLADNHSDGRVVAAWAVQTKPIDVEGAVLQNRLPSENPLDT